jgi:hypothetical protein
VLRRASPDLPRDFLLGGKFLAALRVKVARKRLLQIACVPAIRMVDNDEHVGNRPIAIDRVELGDSGFHMAGKPPRG